MTRPDAARRFPPPARSVAVPAAEPGRRGRPRRGDASPLRAGVRDRLRPAAGGAAGGHPARALAAGIARARAGGAGERLRRVAPAQAALRPDAPLLRAPAGEL